MAEDIGQRENASIYVLLTELCNKSASKYCAPSKAHTVLASKMRSHAYEIILKKTDDVNYSKRPPVSDLVMFYITSSNNAKNVAEYKRANELKELIATLKATDFGDSKDCVYNGLRLLVGLSNTVKEDLSDYMYQNPFSFGLLEQMLPKPPREAFGSPQPYSYYPSHVFDLPYSVKQQGDLESKRSQCYTEYSIERFQSKSLLQENSFFQWPGVPEPKTFPSPMSLASMTSSHASPYANNSLFSYSRLDGPRDLQLPSSDQSMPSNIRISQASTSVKEPTKVVFKANTDCDSMDIWELASQVDKDIPDDIWDIASKLPPIKERQLIAEARKDVALWRGMYGSSLADMEVVSEKQFIRHVMYLIIGVETSTFPYSEESSCFYIKENILIEGVTKANLQGYVSNLLLVGTFYKRLYNFAFNQTLEDHAYKNGLVYEAAREVVRHYLLEFRLKATEIFEDTTKDSDVNCMPTLLQIMMHIEPLKYEIETMASIYKLVDIEPVVSIAKGADLMSYLFNEISMVSHKQTAHTTFNALFSVCKVYFKFIERFIFEGELEDRYHEFFIRKDSQYAGSRSKRYWDKGYHISQSVAVPAFLQALAKCILLCGKSLRLLKLCNPADPLVVLISSDHPTVKCCASFEQLERQRRALAVYRTRCLFVSGQPASLEQILLRREAERKAFAEMASARQHETMDKIVAERKRLAQLIVAEKQHSLRVLEAAMAEAEASRGRARQRGRRRSQLERAAEKAKDEADAALRDDEKNKIMEYYSKLNMQVEKTKLHTEWKIKRLQLDQSRMQLLSTEERNLKREKMELVHQRNDEVMAMSIRSDDEGETTSLDQDASGKTSYESIPDEKEPADSEFDDNKSKAQASTDIISALCNVAKNFFIGTKNDSKNCDNKKDLDAQGNVMSVDEINSNKSSKKSSDIIGGGIDNLADQIEYLKTRKEALNIKQKVMALEFGQLDEQNNPLKQFFRTKSVDDENNVVLTPSEEAQRNKNKVLGADFDVVEQKSLPKIAGPRTEASKEAARNKQKVLGVEYNLPAQLKEISEPANIAQKEALVNKSKVMGVEYNLPSEAKEVNEPANYAQEQAIRNKQKILGVEYNLPLESKEVVEPANYAQEQAVLNKQKILGVKYNLPEDPKERKEPANAAQEAALVNRLKILGEGNQPIEDRTLTFTTKQDDASKNRRKVMGVEYNLPAEERERHEPCTDAQESALRNRLKASSSDISVRSADVVSRPKRLGLTLDLKTHSDTALGAFSLGITPNTGAVTPGDLFPRLDLETPTTADIPHDDLLTAGTFTPTSALSREIHSAKKDKEFMSPDEFNFSVLVDDETSEFQGSDSVDHSPCNQIIPSRKRPTFNFLDGSYSLENFDPFGVRELKMNSKDTLSSRMDLDMSSSFYTHPAKIMEEVQKKPYGNIFASHFAPKDEEEDSKIECDNIATLTACLQRSVMLPLTYQLEVVNNSILTYFLVNLDMYEHLSSLKDYFFLMDGEFSRSICHNLFSKLMTTINPQELLNFSTLHNILDKALGSSISHVHKFSENLSFTMSEPPLSFQHSSPDVLQCLSLTYTVSWPLNIILSQEALLRYAKLFQFLLKMRRISWVLGEDFGCLKLSAKLSRGDSRKLLRSPQYISIQLYRHVMASLIRGLDNYIVTTCILTSWREFENDLKKARTLDDLYECHVVYIKKVLFRCLLNNRSTPVMKLLNDIFTVILKFSRMLKSGEWQLNPHSGRFSHTNFSHLKELFHLFDKLANYLHKVVTRLMEVGYQRHLVELLTLVNLNGYYDPDRSKDQNSSVQSP